MPVKFTEQEINAFISEAKQLPANYKTLIHMKPRRGHNESELDIIGENGHQFRIILRQSRLNSFDFSVILAILPEDTNKLFRLRRYNGKQEHSNKIEGDRFYNFHIHSATERYQEFGEREDLFAEYTDRYSDITGAIKCLIDDCGFMLPPNNQLQLL